MHMTELTKALVADKKLLDGHVYPASRLAKMYNTTVEDVKIRKNHAKGLLAAAELALRETEGNRHDVFIGDILPTTPNQNVHISTRFSKKCRKVKNPKRHRSKNQTM